MATGISLALITGLLFMVIGIFYSYAGNRIDILDVLLLNNLLLGIVFSGCVLREGIPPAMGFPAAVMVFTGVINILAMIVLQKAMSTGHPGAAWAIAQSALVGPYLGALFFLGERPVVIHIVGIAFILSGLVLLIFSSKKGADADPGAGGGKYRWLMLALLAFGLLVAAQYVVTASSHWSVQATPALRAGAMTWGGVLSVLGLKTVKRQYQVRLDRLTLLCAAGLTVVGVVSQITTFLTVDQLSKYDAAGIGYPIMMGSCIALFFLYTVLVLKEKSSVWGKCAVVMLVAGIFSLCFS